MQVAATYKGFGAVINSSVFYVGEYNNRKRLRELGFTSPLESLDALTAEYLIMIDREVSNLESEELRKKAGH